MPGAGHVDLYGRVELIPSASSSNSSRRILARGGPTRTGPGRDDSNDENCTLTSLSVYLCYAPITVEKACMRTILAPVSSTKMRMAISTLPRMVSLRRAMLGETAR